MRTENVETCDGRKCIDQGCKNGHGQSGFALKKKLGIDLNVVPFW